MPQFPQNVNLSLVEKRTRDITQAISKLQRRSGAPVETFLDNRIALDASKYTFMTAVEAAILISKHLTGEIMPQTPDDYTGCFTALASNGVISEALSERLNGLASFRYMLEHAYYQVDDRRLWEILRYELGDLEVYLDAVYSAAQELSP